VDLLMEAAASALRYFANDYSSCLWFWRRSRPRCGQQSFWDEAREYDFTFEEANLRLPSFAGADLWCRSATCQSVQVASASLPR